MALIHAEDDVDSGSEQVKSKLPEMIALIGENITLRRVIRDNTDGHWSVYQHNEKILAYVALNQNYPSVGKDVAMHVTAFRPVCLATSDFPSDVLSKEEASSLDKTSEGKSDVAKHTGRNAVTCIATSLPTDG